MEKPLPLKAIYLSVNLAEVLDKPFNNELGGYVVDDYLITPINENGEPAIFSGSFEEKLNQLFDVEGYNFRIIK